MSVVAVEDQSDDLGPIRDVQRFLDELAGRPVSRHHDEKPVHPFLDDPAVGDRHEGRGPRAAPRKSASMRRTRASGAWASAPARLIEVVVLPSATVGLETATTTRPVDLWSCSIRWRSARYCSASNEVGASKLTRCSSSPLAAPLGSSGNDRRPGSGADSGTGGSGALVEAPGAA